MADNANVFSLARVQPKLRCLTENKIFLGWCILGQLIMVGIKGKWAVLDIILRYTKGLAIFFPTIEKTEFPKIFDPALASRYLILMWVLLPLLCGVLLLIPDSQIIPKGMRLRKASMLPLILILSGLSLYAANFKWDGDILVNLLGSFSIGFALLGSLLVSLLAYTLRLCLAYLRLRKIDDFWGADFWEILTASIFDVSPRPRGLSADLRRRSARTQSPRLMP